MFTWRSWGDGFVNVNESGHLEILTDPQTDAHIDLHELLEQVRKQSVRPPVLVRFPQLIDQQMAKSKHTHSKLYLDLKIKYQQMK